MTNYPIIVCIPDKFQGAENNIANHGLTALGDFLVKAIVSQGYHAEVAWGGMDKTVVLIIQRKI